MGPSHVGVSYHPEFQVLVTQLPSSTSAEELNVCSMITFVQSPFCFHLWSWMTVYQLHMEQAADVSFSEVHHETIGVLVYYLNSVRCPKHFSFTRGSSCLYHSFSLSFYEVLALRAVLLLQLLFGNIHHCLLQERLELWNIKRMRTENFRITLQTLKLYLSHLIHRSLRHLCSVMPMVVVPAYYSNWVQLSSAICLHEEVLVRNTVFFLFVFI